MPHSYHSWTTAQLKSSSQKGAFFMSQKFEQRVQIESQAWKILKDGDYYV